MQIVFNTIWKRQKPSRTEHFGRELPKYFLGALSSCWQKKTNLLGYYKKFLFLLFTPKEKMLSWEIWNYNVLFEILPHNLHFWQWFFQQPLGIHLHSAHWYSYVILIKALFTGITMVTHCPLVVPTVLFVEWLELLSDWITVLPMKYIRWRWNTNSYI